MCPTLPGWALKYIRDPESTRRGHFRRVPSKGNGTVNQERTAKGGKGCALVPACLIVTALHDLQGIVHWGMAISFFLGPSGGINNAVVWKILSSIKENRSSWGRRGEVSSRPGGCEEAVVEGTGGGSIFFRGFISEVWKSFSLEDVLG